MLLVFGGRDHSEGPWFSEDRQNNAIECDIPVDRALDIPACEERERIARIHRDRAILRLNPLPFPRLVILDLQGCDWLTEEEGEGAQILSECE